jgi:hypothetical protein
MTIVAVASLPMARAVEAAPKLRPLPTPSARWQGQGLYPLGGTGRLKQLPQPPRPPDAIEPPPPAGAPAGGYVYPPPAYPPAAFPPPAHQPNDHPPSGHPPHAYPPAAPPPAPLPAPPEGGWPVPTWSAWPPPDPAAVPTRAPRPNPSRAYDAGLVPRYPATRSPFSLDAIDELMADGEEEVSTVGEGLFARVLAGPTLFDVDVTSKDQSASATIQGWGLGLAAMLGGWLSPNLVLTGELSMTTSAEPSVEGDAIAAPQGSFTFSTFALGADVHYLLEPLSLSVSGGLLLSQLRLVDQATSYTHAGTRLGPALVAGVSKEWPISSGWNLGATVRGSLAWPEDIRRSLDLTMVGGWFGLSVSYD